MPLADSFGIDPEDLTDLRIAHVLEIDHTDQLSLRIRQLLQDGLRFAVDRVLENGIFVLCGRLNIFRIGIQGEDLGPPAAPVFIDQRIACNVRELGLHRGLCRIVGVIVRHRFEEDVADQILRALTVQKPGVYIVIDAGVLVLKDN